MHEFKVKIDGLKKDDVIYLEPICTYHVGKFDLDKVEELKKELVKKGLFRGIDKRWNPQ